MDRIRLGLLIKKDAEGIAIVKSVSNIHPQLKIPRNFVGRANGKSADGLYHRRITPRTPSALQPDEPTGIARKALNHASRSLSSARR